MGSTPYHFQCSVCRRRKPWHPDLDPQAYRKGLLTRVALTGQIKPVGRHRGTDRNVLYRIQYRCNDCDHVGTSSHIELYRRAVREGLLTPGELDPPVQLEIC